MGWYIRGPKGGAGKGGHQYKVRGLKRWPKGKPLPLPLTGEERRERNDGRSYGWHTKVMGQFPPQHSQEDLSDKKRRWGK